MTDESARLARRWFDEVWNQRRPESIDELAAPDCLGHQVNGDLHGVDALRKMQQKYLRAIPDIQVDVEEVIGQGGTGVVRWRFHGTHAGPGLGVAPSGRHIDVRGMTWMRFEGGKIVEAWDSWNFDGMIRQLSKPEGD